MSTKLERIYSGEPARQPPKREAKMREIIHHLQKNPILQVALERAGVPRPTYYRWRVNDFVFARACDRCLEESRFIVNDKAESNIIRKINDGDIGMSKYWLEHHHPKYAKRAVEVPSHAKETVSIEEFQRENRREKRVEEVVWKGIQRKLRGDIDERHEREALAIEDQMFERFEMLKDDTADDEAS